MIEKNIGNFYIIIGVIILSYGIEQLLGYLLFRVTIIISWWIGFISILLGICLICRGKELYSHKSQKSNK
jgi:hypothetical protein